PGGRGRASSSRREITRAGGVLPPGKEQRMSDRRRWFPPALALGAILLLCGLAAPAQAQTCAPAWSATQVYTAGNQASLNGINYQANWWTLGESPATHNGGPGSGQPWTNIGSCSGSGGCTVIPSGRL